MYNFRVHRGWEAHQGLGCPGGGYQEQKVPINHLFGKGSGTHHDQISGIMCGPQESLYGQGGLVPVPQHVPICNFIITHIKKNILTIKCFPYIR